MRSSEKEIRKLMGYTSAEKLRHSSGKYCNWLCEKREMNSEISVGLPKRTHVSIITPSFHITLGATIFGKLISKKIDE